MSTKIYCASFRPLPLPPADYSSRVSYYNQGSESYPSPLTQHLLSLLRFALGHYGQVRLSEFQLRGSFIDLSMWMWPTMTAVSGSCDSFISAKHACQNRFRMESHHLRMCLLFLIPGIILLEAALASSGRTCPRQHPSKCYGA